MTPTTQSVVVRRADLEEVRDLLMERIYGNNARSPGHNARLAVEAMLAAAAAPSSLAGGELIDRFEKAAFEHRANLPRGSKAARDAEDDRGRAEYHKWRDAILAALSPEAPARAGGRHGVYVASRASAPERPAMWRRLRDAGHLIISTWIDEAGEGESHDLGDLWGRILREVTSAERLVLYAEAEDFPLKGAYVEVGMALAADVPVYVVTPGVALNARSLRPLGSWAKHPLVTFCATVEEAFAALTPRHEAPADNVTILVTKAQRDAALSSGKKLNDWIGGILQRAVDEAPAEGAGERDDLIARLEEMADFFDGATDPVIAETVCDEHARDLRAVLSALRARSSALEARDAS